MEPTSTAPECLKWTDKIRKSSEYVPREQRTKFGMTWSNHKGNFMEHSSAPKCLEWDDEKPKKKEEPKKALTAFQKFLRNKKLERKKQAELKEYLMFKEQHCNKGRNKKLENAAARLFGSSDTVARFNTGHNDEFEDFYANGYIDTMSRDDRFHVKVQDKRYIEAHHIQTRLNRAFRLANLGAVPRKAGGKR
uniref:Uncharacterized protein n=1 Tax=Lotharella oceanica TaxID=641309 RepID=A0A7S2XE60_9EUKA